VTNEQNDTVTLQASGLPSGASFDVFLVQNSALDAGFNGFSSSWYQSDLESDARVQQLYGDQFPGCVRDDLRLPLPHDHIVLDLGAAEARDVDARAP
jgi:hypothetical protein